MGRVAQLVELRSSKPQVIGSSPFPPVTPYWHCFLVAQLVERRAVNSQVVGSSPAQEVGEDG